MSLSSLPVELKLGILKHLDLKTLTLAVARLNKEFYLLSRDKSFYVSYKQSPEVSLKYLRYPTLLKHLRKLDIYAKLISQLDNEAFISLHTLILRSENPSLPHEKVCATEIRRIAPNIKVVKFGFNIEPITILTNGFLPLLDSSTTVCLKFEDDYKFLKAFLASKAKCSFSLRARTVRGDISNGFHAIAEFLKESKGKSQLDKVSVNVDLQTGWRFKLDRQVYQSRNVVSKFLNYLLLEVSDRSKTWISLLSAACREFHRLITLHLVIFQPDCLTEIPASDQINPSFRTLHISSQRKGEDEALEKLKYLLQFPEELHLNCVTLKTCNLRSGKFSKIKFSCCVLSRLVLRHLPTSVKSVQFLRYTVLAPEDNVVDELPFYLEPTDAGGFEMRMKREIPVEHLSFNQCDSSLMTEMSKVIDPSTCRTLSIYLREYSYPNFVSGGIGDIIDSCDQLRTLNIDIKAAPLSMYLITSLLSSSKATDSLNELRISCTFTSLGCLTVNDLTILATFNNLRYVSLPRYESKVTEVDIKRCFPHAAVYMDCERIQFSPWPSSVPYRGH